MTKRMVNAAVLVAVLTVAVMAPSTTFAAGHGSKAVSVESKSAGIVQMLLDLIGYNPVRGNKPAPTTPTTDTATWTGGNRCLYGC